ncbi:ferritin heavy chain-like [Saccopteryx bilineata]|uniref:ferritin heavy chain-like n=1 Tax=Saccopteryx bilineata TaxID=59482 RepID=UPI00338F8EA6
MASSLPSLVSETYHPDCEAAITDQIQLELYAAHIYGSMAFYLDKMVSKPFALFFQEQSGKERATADRLIQLVKQSLLSLHQLATEKKDTLLCDFLESHCLQEQLKFNKELEDHITILCQMGAPEPGPAEHHCGKLPLDDSKD